MSNKAPGRNRRSVIALAADSASACSCRRRETALALSDWRIRALSVPANSRVVDSSMSSGTPISSPSRPRADHGDWPLSSCSGKGPRHAFSRPVGTDQGRGIQRAIDTDTAGQAQDHHVHE